MWRGGARPPSLGRRKEAWAPRAAATPPSASARASATDLSGGQGQVWAGWRGREPALRSPPCSLHSGLSQALPGLPRALGKDIGGPWSDSHVHSTLCHCVGPEGRCHLVTGESLAMARSLTRGCCPWCLTDEEKTAARIDQEINKILLEQKKQERGELKLLLLGECGRHSGCL